MRTTVRLDDHLMKQAKAYALERGSTLTELFESALREKLSRGRGEQKPTRRRPLPTFSGKGLQPGVDLHDTAALLELMDGVDA